MKVEVVIKKWGNYSKGESLDIPDESTARACIKNGAVKEFGKKEAKQKVTPKSKK